SISRIARQISGHGSLDRPAPSFSLDVRRFDDRPPLLDLGRVVRGKPLRRLLLAWKYLLAEICEPRTHVRIGEGLPDRGVELADDGLGRGLRRKQRKPPRNVNSRQHIRSRGEAAAGGDGASLDCASTNLRQGYGRLDDHQVDLASHKILHGRTPTAIWHKR